VTTASPDDAVAATKSYAQQLVRQRRVRDRQRALAMVNVRATEVAALQLALPACDPVTVHRRRP
jgi:hypothetical protein